MTYVVTENCYGCRYTDCVVVCPVDCFYALPGMLVINPDECIDCGVCAPECRVEAIYADTAIPDDQHFMIDFNREHTYSLTNAGPITRKEPPLPDADLRASQLGY